MVSQEKVDQGTPGDRDQQMRNVRGTLSARAAVVIMLALGTLADMSEIADLFGRPWESIVVVLGSTAAVAGVTMLARLWRSPLNGKALGAFGLIVAAILAIGYALWPETSVGPDPLPPAKPFIQIAGPSDGTQVPWQGPVTVTATNLERDQAPWIYIRDEQRPDIWPQPCHPATDGTAEQFQCWGLYGSDLGSRGRRFVLSAVIVDHTGHAALSAVQQRGKQAWFPLNQPPAQPLAQSVDVVVQRQE